MQAKYLRWDEALKKNSFYCYFLELRWGGGDGTGQEALSYILEGYCGFLRIIVSKLKSHRLGLEMILAIHNLNLSFW